MLQIFCGDNTVAARDAFCKALQQYQAKKIEPEQVVSQDILLLRSQDMFGENNAYATENIVRLLKRAGPRGSWRTTLNRWHTDTLIHLLVWEGESAYDLGLDKKKDPYYTEHAYTANTFSLLRACVPGNAKECLQTLDILTTHQPIEVTYAMLVRHARAMLVARSGSPVRDLAFVAGRHTLWETSGLVRWYETLWRIDQKRKTSQSPLALRGQVELAIIAIIGTHTHDQ